MPLTRDDRGVSGSRALGGSRIFLLPDRISSNELRKMILFIRNHGATTVRNPVQADFIVVRLRQGEDRDAIPVTEWSSAGNDEWNLNKILYEFTIDPRGPNRAVVVEEGWLHHSVDVGFPLAARDDYGKWGVRGRLVSAFNRGQPTAGYSGSNSTPRDPRITRGSWGNIRRSPSPSSRHGGYESPPQSAQRPPMTLREKLTAQMTGNVEGSDERYDEPNGAVYPDAAASPAATLEQRLSRVPYAADQNGQGGHSPSPRIPATSNEARLESRLGQKFVSTSDTSRLPLHRRISDASAIKVKTEPEDPLPIPEDPPMKASPRIPEPKADVTAQPPVSAVPPSDIKTSTAVAYQDPIPKAAQHVTPIAIPEPPKDSLPLSSLSAPPSASLPSPNAVVDMEIDVDDEPASVVFNTAQGVPNGVTSEGASPAAPKATKQLSNSVDAVLQDKNTPTPASPAKIIMASELETIARSTTTLRPELATPQVVHRADIIPAPATVITALDPGPTPGTAHISSPSIQDSRKLVAPAVSSPKAVVSVLQPVSAPPSLMNQPPPPTKHRLSLTNQNVGSLNSAVVTLSNAPPRPPPLALAPSSAPVTQRSDPVTARSHIPTPAEGIFSANLRFPLTFYLEDAPARLARIVEENGGELTSLGEALFVVLPLDKGETAKERRHRRLASGVGIHPCARVVSREWIGRSAVYGDELLDPAPFIVKLDESKDYTEVDKERQESELSSVPPSERSSAPLSRKRSYNQTSARPDPTHRPNSTQGHSAKQSHTRIPSTTSARCENDPEFEWEWESDLEDELDDDGDDVEDDQDMEIVIRPENIPSADWRRIKVIIAAFKAWDQKGGKIEFLKRLRRDEDVTNAEGIYRRYHEYIDSKVTGLARHSRNRKKRIKLEVVNNAQYN